MIMTDVSLTSREDFSIPMLAWKEHQTLLKALFSNMVESMVGVPLEPHSACQPLGSLGVDIAQANLLKDNIETRVGIAMPETTMVRDSSIDQLVRHALDYSEAASTISRATNSERYSTPPLSLAQWQVWHQCRCKYGSYSSCNISTAVRLTGLHDVDALIRSLNELVRRHDILRTTVTVVNGQPVQAILPTLALTIPLLDLGATDDEGPKNRARRLLTEESQLPFDLARGPLIRTTLLNVGDDDVLLVLTMHRLVSDIESADVFTRELLALYTAFSMGQSSPLPDLPIQYGDYATWLSRSSDSAPGRHEAFWARQLTDVPNRLQIPLDRPRPEGGEFRRAMHSFALPVPLSASLGTFSCKEGVTLLVTLLGAFATLLHRYTGQDDIVVSAPFSRRTSGATEHLIGPFINALPLRVNVSGEPTARELLQRVRDVVIGAYAHRTLPVNPAAQMTHPPGQYRLSALSQVSLHVYRTPVRPQEATTTRLQPLGINVATPPSDMALSIEETPDALIGTCTYDANLFDSATIERMIGHFHTLLTGIVADPDRRMSHAPFLTEAERQQLLVDWNETSIEYPNEQCLHELIETQAARMPDAAAVLFEGNITTYRDLDLRSNQLAQYLRSAGVGTEGRVGICVERSPELVIGILGILKAGAAYVPLDPAYPQERLSFMLDDAQVPILLTQEGLLAQLPANGARIVCLDADWNDIARGCAVGIKSRVAADNLAYIIYTSGSTGRPKGIALQHRGVVNNITDLNRRFAVGPDDRVLALSSLSFDMCVYELLAPLIAGGAIVMPSPSSALDPGHWIELIGRHHVTVWNSAPPLLSMLVDHVGGIRECGPLSLRLALLGGDWIPITLPDRLKSLAPGVQVIGLGGATEASIHSTIYPIEVHDPQWMSIPYGRPMANQRAYVLDQHLQPVPVGVAGELHLGGVGLARGYFKQPALTAEKFVPDPFSRDEGGRLYKTGDLVRHRSDGNLELLGRIDNQVKIRGLRVELEEITAALRLHHAIRNAVVVTRESENVDKQLVAYIVFTGSPIPDGELRDALRATLPEYMVPAAFVPLASLPLSPNGKVDYRALPAPDTARPRLKEPLIIPRNPVEEVVAGIWADILGLEQVGIHDDFFALGGHSLLVTRVVTRIQEFFGVQVLLRRLFEEPTVAQTAEYIEALGRDTSRDIRGIARLLIHLNQMSDDAVRATLMGHRD